MDMLRRASSAWLFASCVTAVPFGLAAQVLSQETGRPVASVFRIDSDAPVVDGRLDDVAWAGAQVITGFFQREPVEGEPVSERTEVRILADGEALYVGAWLYDRTPDQIVLGERVRDANLETGDYFGIILDTYRDRQNGFIFYTTPASIEYDAQVVREGQGGGVFQRGQTRQQAGSAGGLNVNWDGSWEVAASRDGQGWYAEFRIPFSTLRYTGGSVQTWGMNLVRRIRRRNEESFWAPVPRQYNLMRLSMAGDLVGVPVPVQRAATVSPYVLGSAQRDYVNAPDDTDYPREIGVDAKLTLASMTLDLTTNTDFAQVEVDEQRTNLTRFPLFFPEKRPFFLENAGTFTAGDAAGGGPVLHPEDRDLFRRQPGADPGWWTPQREDEGTRRGFSPDLHRRARRRYRARRQGELVLGGSRDEGGRGALPRRSHVRAAACDSRRRRLQPHVRSGRSGGDR